MSRYTKYTSHQIAKYKREKRQAAAKWAKAQKPLPAPTRLPRSRSANIFDIDPKLRMRYAEAFLARVGKVDFDRVLAYGKDGLPLTPRDLDTLKSILRYAWHSSYFTSLFYLSVRGDQPPPPPRSQRLPLAFDDFDLMLDSED